VVFIPLLVVILALLFVWYTAEELLGFYLLPAIYDLYSLLSFEFEPLDVIKRKMKKGDSAHIKRMMGCLPLKILSFRKGWDKEEALHILLCTMIEYMRQNAMAEMMEFSFEDDEESLRHPIVQALTEEELAGYKKKEQNLRSISDEIEELSDKQEDTELVQDLSQLNVMMEEIHAVIFCVRKLPFSKRPKVKRPRIVLSPEEVMTKVENK